MFPINGQNSQINIPANPKSHSLPSSPAHQQQQLPFAVNQGLHFAKLHSLLCSSDDDSGCAVEELYAWVPPNTKPELVQAFFAALPPEKVPRLGSIGEQWRLQQLERQLPPQDTSPRHCVDLEESEARALVEFARHREMKALGRGEICRLGGEAQGTATREYCHQCKTSIGANELAVIAPQHFGEHAFWHPNCFVCVECKELLVDLLYHRHRDNVFCGRHHAELTKPRCSGCDQLIFTEECTEAEGRLWHLRHFCCVRCGIQLGGHKYLMIGQEEDNNPGKPCCLGCYPPRRMECSPSEFCRTCGAGIPVDRAHIAQGDFRWHADVKCFCCSNCQCPLLGQPFSLMNGRLFCASRRTCAANFQHSTPSTPQSPLPPPTNSSSSPQTSCFRPSPLATRAVRFNLRQNAALTLNSPPPLPERGPPPAPLVQAVQHRTASTASTATASEEHVYETLIPTAVVSSTPASAVSTSSGCSANGSLTSSSSFSAKMMVVPGKCCGLGSIRSGNLQGIPINSSPHHPYLDDLLSSSAEDEPAPSVADSLVAMLKRPKPLRRRCRSADGRRQKARGREKKNPNNGQSMTSALALATTREQKPRKHRATARSTALGPFSSSSSIDTTNDSSSDSDDDSEGPPPSTFLRHYMAIASNAKKMQNSPKKAMEPQKNCRPMMRTNLRQPEQKQLEMMGWRRRCSAVETTPVKSGRNGGKLSNKNANSQSSQCRIS